jgi:putative ABC transport system permease protein
MGIVIVEEIRFALRALARQPGATLVIAATLALGVGVNSAVFSVVNGVLLRALPYDRPERIVALWRTSPAAQDDPHSAGDFLELKRDARAFERLAGYRETAFDLLPAVGGEPQRVPGAEVTPAFFDVFGLPAALGRAPREDDDAPGSRLVVLSDGAWRRLFAADPGVVGRTLRFDDVSLTVAGVMPPRFRWPPSAEVWRLADLPVPSSPLPRQDDTLLANHGLRYFEVLGRLREGVTPAAAQAELDALAQRLAEAHPDNDAGRGLRLVSFEERLLGGVGRSLTLLLGVVGLVLLVAAANVANLLLSQGPGRARELAVRASLGASPARLLRQLLVESLLLGLVGGVAALAATWLSLPLVVRLLPADLPRRDEIGVDGRVVAVTLTAALATSLLCGLLPALQALRCDHVGALHAGGRTLGGPGRRLRRVLVAAELAVALAVLSGAGLLLRSFATLDAVDPGFRGEAVTAVALDLPAARYATRAEQTRFYDHVLERLSSSGRFEVAAGFPLPFGDGAASAAPVQREGRVAAAGGETPMALFGTVTPGYFRLMGIPLLAGRDFTDADGPDAPRVVIISDALARRDFAGEDPLGMRFRIGGDEPFTIVGVVGDVRRRSPDAPPEPTLYLAHRQFILPRLHLLARGGDAAAVAVEARAAVRGVDPALPVARVEPLDAARSRVLAQPRFRAVALGLFAALALALAAVGLFGVMSDAAQRRRQEMGVRLALGARPGDLVRLLVDDGLRLALAGCVVGAGAALALGRLLASFLFGVRPADPPVLLAVALLLVGVALLAAWLPARRAARVDPLTALRAE